MRKIFYTLQQNKLVFIDCRLLNNYVCLAWDHDDTNTSKICTGDYAMRCIHHAFGN